jgi:hypothetical protein
METKKPRELIKIINICKKMGVIELKFEGIELKLSPLALNAPKQRKQQKQESEEPSQREYTDEETLMWSSPAQEA